jgi:hypothetical protein
MSTNHTRSMCICIWTLWLSCSQRFLSYLALGVPDEGFSRNGRVRWVWNLRFYYYHWVDTTSAGGWLVLEGSIHPVISVSALTCFIRYIFYCNLQLLNYLAEYKKMAWFLQIAKWAVSKMLRRDEKRVFVDFFPWSVYN